MTPKLCLFLMTEKGYQVLTFIIENYSLLIHEVVVGEDKSVQKDYSQEIKSLCKSNGITYFDRKNFVETNASHSICVSWRWLIQNTSNLIVLHDSILPKYRGFAPLVNSLLNRETEIGVTALYASDRYDEGEIIAISKHSITYPIKIADAITTISLCYMKIIDLICNQLLFNNRLVSYPQNNDLASYSVWLDEEDYHIDWNMESVDILRFIDAVGFPYNGAFSYVDNSKYRIFDAELVTDVKIENRHCGKVLFIEDGCPIVICGKGLLKITKITNLEGVSILPASKIRLRFF